MADGEEQSQDRAEENTSDASTVVVTSVGEAPNDEEQNGGELVTLPSVNMREGNVNDRPTGSYADGRQYINENELPAKDRTGIDDPEEARIGQGCRILGLRVFQDAFRTP